MKRAAFLGCSLALLACSKSDPKSIALTRRALPGLSFDVPAGKETTTELDYSAGRIARSVEATSGRAWVHVRWSFNVEVDASAMLDLVRGIAKGMGMDTTAPHEVTGGAPHTFALDKASHDLITLYRCGGRNVMLITTDVDTVLHQRIAQTYKCSPDPAQENASSTIGIHIDLPGYRATQRSPGLVIIDNGSTMVTLGRQALAPLTFEQIDRAAPEFLKGGGFENPTIRRVGDVLTFAATVNGAPRNGLMRYVKCPGFQVQILMEGEPAGVAALDPTLRAARCIEPGEQPSDWPDAQQ